MIHEPRIHRLRPLSRDYVAASGQIDIVGNLEIASGGAAFFDVPERRNPRLDRMSCWVLPHWGVRVCCWSLVSDEVQLASDFDWFIDSCESLWIDGSLVMKDQYIDVQLWDSGEVSVVDVDEMLEALLAGRINSQQAQRAVEGCVTATVFLQGIAADERRRALNEQVGFSGR